MKDIKIGNFRGTLYSGGCWAHVMREVVDVATPSRRLPSLIVLRPAASRLRELESRAVADLCVLCFDCVCVVEKKGKLSQNSFN